jgi:hypothetical protein
MSTTKTKTASKPAGKKPVVVIQYAQDNLTGFNQVAYWVLHDLPTARLKEHLRSIKIGIPKTKTEMVEKIHAAALGGPVRVSFSLSII